RLDQVILIRDSVLSAKEPAAVALVAPVAAVAAAAAPIAPVLEGPPAPESQTIPKAGSTEEGF
ncbi:MAG: hypothetical protein ABIT01_11715, partial [Thermoanaerobaculia bacterium]